MEMQLSDADLIETAMVQDVVVCPLATYEDKATCKDKSEHDSGRSTARGIMTAVVIAAPFWALVAFTIYMLL
jgi:hypothetical protein